MNTLKTIGISAIISLLVISGVNFLTFSDNIGAVVSILGTDKLKNSRTTINDNFTDLDTTKMEMATTSVASITTLASLTTTGTIGTGTWNADILTVAYGGTGSTTPTGILYGDGAGAYNTIDFGTSGQFLQSQGAGTLPSFETTAINQADDYNWTGTNFLVKNLSASSTVANPITLNGVSYAFPSSDGTSADALTTNGSGTLSWSSIAPFVDATTTATTLTNTTSETNLASTTIPANILGTNGIVIMNIPITDFDIRAIATDDLTLKAYYGATSVSCVIEQNTGTNITNTKGWLKGYVMGADSTSSQKIIVSIQLMDSGFDLETDQPKEVGSTCSTTSSIDSTIDNVFKITGTWNAVSTSNSITADAMVVEKIK